ncbi:tetratricopeptide repeat protein [Chryseobacterium sp. T1]
MKLSFTFFLLFLIITLSGQKQVIIPQDIVDQQKRAENVIEQLNNFKGTPLEKKHFLQPLKKIADTEKTPLWKTIYLGLSANIEAELQDKINHTSNALYHESIKASTTCELKLWSLTNFAYYLYNYRQITSAMPYFIDAVQASKNCKRSNMVNPSDSFKKIGYFMVTLGDTKEAIRFLKIAEEYAPNQSSELASILDNIGYGYLVLNNDKEAEKYFNKAKHISIQIKDYVRLGKALGNLALLEEKNKNYDQAIAYIKEDLVYSTKFNSDQNTMYALTLLARFYLKKDLVTEAKNTINKAEKFAISKDYFKKNELEILKIKLQIAVLENNSISELDIRRKIEKTSEALKHSDGEEVVKKTNLLVQKEKYLNNITVAQAQYEKEILIRKSIVAIALLLAALIVFIIINNRKKLKAKQNAFDNKILKLHVEKLQSEEKLRLTDHTLGSYKIYLLEKNAQIEKLQKNMESITRNGSSEVQKGEMEDLLRSHLMTESNWNNFKNAFIIEYPEFYNMLIENFPELTESNLRVVLLSKMELSNIDISQLLGITVDAIKKSKQRLRKKLGEKYDSLFENI